MLIMEAARSLNQSALVSSLSVEVLHLVDCNSSHDIWSKLEIALASPSNSWIMQLHGSLKDLRARMMILPASTCRRQRPCLMNLLQLAGRSP